MCFCLFCSVAFLLRYINVDSHVLYANPMFNALFHLC